MSNADPDQVKTQLMQKIRWLPPVQSVHDLPVEGVAPGMHCFVESDDAEADEEIWAFNDGQWTRVDTL